MNFKVGDKLQIINSEALGVYSVLLDGDVCEVKDIWYDGSPIIKMDTQRDFIIHKEEIQFVKKLKEGE